MELLVAEQRAVVAADALRLADEEAQATGFVGPQQATGCRVAAQHRVDVAVQPGRPVLQRLLVRRDGLADVREHARHVLATAGVDRRPSGLLGRMALGAGVARQSIEPRQ
ncbi:MAG: hypothetical protein MUF16_10855, partial [Burkholderiaceae bacterium]|nr:hypothetical protein [Burkholderiaceae bacterium]